MPVLPPALPTDADLTQDPARALIAASRVQGTNVYGQDQEHIGVVEDVMLEKHDGRVAYAVLSFGGFMGFGSRHYPLPWRLLRYEPALAGYVVRLTRERLEKAPVVSDDRPGHWATVDQYWAA